MDSKPYLCRNNHNETDVARAIIDGLIAKIREDGPWEVAEAPDGHSLAWHGVCILVNAKSYLDGIPEDPRVSWMYTPIFTRDV